MIPENLAFFVIKISENPVHLTAWLELALPIKLIKVSELKFMLSLGKDQLSSAA